MTANEKIYEEMRNEYMIYISECLESDPKTTGEEERKEILSKGKDLLEKYCGKILELGKITGRAGVQKDVCEALKKMIGEFEENMVIDSIREISGNTEQDDDEEEVENFDL